MDKVTAIDDVILAVVAALKAAVTYPVFDGPPSKLPDRGVDRFVAIGADDINDQTKPANSAKMQQQWYGLGQVARLEDLQIDCVAVGRAKSIASARSIANVVVKDVGTNLGKHLTAETYGAMVGDVGEVRSHNTTGGAVVQILFTITASARLT
jgi:hypothetical protein